MITTFFNGHSEAKVTKRVFVSDHYDGQSLLVREEELPPNVIDDKTPSGIVFNNCNQNTIYNLTNFLLFVTSLIVMIMVFISIGYVFGAIGVVLSYVFAADRIIKYSMKAGTVCTKAILWCMCKINNFYVRLFG